ncbi:GNAT family N-acetyltransferase [Hahella sp. KA22]|uniref:GNAT family N-acetyltransferase n=1 Tax=Hahella sp. KA22 TaxID=1628392 RepID=UPI000FDDC674|nr:GNAT family N-acetyltransferase [Hahella sp. KA22]AZZ93424.1 GNAT family N-acetyltransferase [Hahella sp. KA22]QAY56799.1 GNAT family N-acetyltransferase [Hahella sp. KA22]
MPSLGLQTDLMFSRYSGLVEDVGRYVVITTPSNPNYYFGNYLLLKAPPQAGQWSDLELDFARYVGAPPRIKHFAFQWRVSGDEDGADMSGFMQRGYEYMECAVLTAKRTALLEPQKVNADIDVRMLQSEEDWRAWYELELQERDIDQPKEDYVAYLQGVRDMYRSMIAAGRGDWFGAFQQGELVGSVGLFFDERIGRFQNVLTKSSHRSQGICHTLVHAVAKAGFDRADTLVMVADENYHAARIYESLGFQPSERQASLCRRNDGESKSGEDSGVEASKPE